MNVHTPERQPNESREQYIQRRKISHELNKAQRRGPTQEPARIDVQPDGTAKVTTNWVSYWTGQHKNPAKNKRRRLVKMLGRRTFRKVMHEIYA